MHGHNAAHWVWLGRLAEAGPLTDVRFDTAHAHVIGLFGKGRVLAFASDMGPHWAPPGFTEWPGYTRLWGQAATWLAGDFKMGQE